MKIHAIQTGVVHVKADFVRGSAAAGNNISFFIKLLTDKEWVDLPIYAWVIEHDEGVIVVDTGDRADSPRNFISQASFTIKPEEQIGAQLARLGISVPDISQVVLTHLHADHVNGLSDLPGVPVFLGEDEYAFYRGWFGGTFSRRTTRLPAGFDPKPLPFSPDAVGPFSRSVALTRAGDVIVVPTPGHTAGHISIIAIQDGLHYFLAGDVTYNEQALLDQKLQGPSLAPPLHPATLKQIREYTQSHPTVYLPSHDWDSGKRLLARQVVPQS